MELITAAAELTALGIFLAVLFWWIKLWISVCECSDSGTFIKRTLNFVFISVVICMAGFGTVWLFGEAEPVLIFLYLGFLTLYVPSCIIAFAVSLIKFLREIHSEKQTEKDNSGNQPVS